MRLDHQVLLRCVATALAVVTYFTTPPPLAVGSDVPARGVPDLEELRRVLADPAQLSAIARRQSTTLRANLGLTGDARLRSSVPRGEVALQERTRQWLDQIPLSEGAWYALPFLEVGAAAESAATAGRVDDLVEALFTRSFVRHAVAQFSPADSRLSLLVEETLEDPGSPVAAEALLRVDHEAPGYFEDVLRRLDPRTQSSAAAAAAGRIEDLQVLETWLANQVDEDLSRVAWRYSGFPEELRRRARALLEARRPDVDWSLEVGGSARRDLIDFYVSYLSESDTGLELPGGAFDLLVELAAGPAARDGDHLQDELQLILVQDAALAQSVLLRAGRALYSSVYCTAVVSAVEAPTGFFLKLLGGLSIGEQPELVAAAARRLAAAGDSRRWVGSLARGELEQLAEVADLLDPRTRGALMDALEHGRAQL